MPTTPDPKDRATYEAARAAFKNLGTTDKTAFVLEATFDTLGQAVSDAGRGLADLFEQVTKEDFWKAPAGSASEGGAEPSAPRGPRRRPAAPGEDIPPATDIPPVI